MLSPLARAAVVHTVDSPAPDVSPAEAMLIEVQLAVMQRRSRVQHYLDLAAELQKLHASFAAKCEDMARLLRSAEGSLADVLGMLELLGASLKTLKTSRLRPYAYQPRREAPAPACWMTSGIVRGGQLLHPGLPTEWDSRS